VIAARLKECLKVLRWSEDDLAEELGCASFEARAWSEGRVVPPLAVAAWVEALVKAHKALPRPSVVFEWPPSRLGNSGLSTIDFVRRSAGGHAIAGNDEPVGIHVGEDKVMNHTRFENPVTLLVGLGLPTTVEGAREAYGLLQDWPEVGRNAAHGVALNACKACIAAEIDAETARTLLVAFARQAGIHLPDAGSLPAFNNTISVPNVIEAQFAAGT
jgi:hypothetical protein